MTPQCNSCGQVVYSQHAIMPDGAVWHRECANRYKVSRNPIRCNHYRFPGQEHLDLPCAHVGCPEGFGGHEYRLPAPDTTRASIGNGKGPPAKHPPDGVYKRRAYEVSELAQVMDGMPPRLYQWVLQ